MQSPYRILWRPRSKVYDYSDYTADENNGVWIAEGNKYSDAAPAYLIHAHSDGKLTSFTFPPHSGYPFRLSTSSRDGAIWYLSSHDVLGSFDVQTHRFELQYGFFPESSFAAEGENIVFVGEQGIRVGRAIRPFRVDTTIPGSFGNANALRTASDTMWLGRFGALYHFRDSSKPQACSTTAVPIFTALTVMPKGQQVWYAQDNPDQLVLEDTHCRTLLRYDVGVYRTPRAISYSSSKHMLYFISRSQDAVLEVPLTSENK